MRAPLFPFGFRFYSGVKPRGYPQVGGNNFVFYPVLYRGRL